MKALRWAIPIALSASLAGCQFLSVDTATGNLFPVPAAKRYDEATLTDIESQIYRKVNRYRDSLGLSPLTLDRSISRQAKIHSQRIAAGIVPFGHAGFDRRAKVISTATPYRTIAENVAVNRGYDDPAEITVQGWIESEGHRQNMAGNFDTTGIGVAIDGEGKLYFTQIFLRRDTAVSSATAPVLPLGGSSLIALERSTNEQVNRYRLSKGLRPLTLDPIISAEARRFSQKMAAKQAPFSHDGFEGRMKAVQVMIPLRSMGENLAWMKGYPDPVSQAVRGWIASPGHEKNMVGDFDTTGIGIAKNAEGAYYFTQLFVKRR